MYKDMVLVKWVDSGGNGRWMDKQQAENDKICEIVSIGYLVVNNEEKITLVQSIDESNQTVNNMITIPKITVVGDIVYLRKK